MLCRLCGGDNHSMGDCESMSAKEFAHGHLRNEVPEVHVLHDLGLRMDSIAFDSQCEKDIGDTHEIRFIDKKVSDIELFCFAWRW